MNLSEFKSLLLKNGYKPKDIDEKIFRLKWYLSEPEMVERKKYIDDKIKGSIDIESSLSHYFEFPQIKLSLFIIPFLQPITFDMIDNFIKGLVLFRMSLIDEKLQPAAVIKLKPTEDKIKEFLVSDVHRNYIIDKITTKAETIAVKMYPSGLDTVSTRKALKEYIKDKPIYPTERILTELKVKFKLHQEKEFVREYKKQTGPSITGFVCPLNPELVEYIYNSMINHKPKPQIKGRLEHFKAIFSNTPTSVDEPIEWLVTHNNEPNKTALFTFIKMMLKLKQMPRELLRHANNLFVSGDEPIFPEKYTYPELKYQRSSFITHFNLIKQSYFPDFLK